MKEVYLWAKKSEKDGQWKWMSLYQHLVDTKNVAGLLWEHWLSKGQQKIIINSINLTSSDNELDAKNLIKFLASVHDIGKATPAFQCKRGFNNSDDLDKYLIEKLEMDGFSELGEVILLNSEKSPHALAGQFLLNKYGVKDDISSIIGGHHGKPVDDRTFKNLQLGYSKNYYQIEDNFVGVGEKWDKTQRNIFEWALHENGYDSIEDLPEIIQPGQVLLLGLIIMADWITSNENYFPLYNLETYSEKNQSLRMRTGWEKWFKTIPLSIHPCFDINYMYKKRFGFLPRDIQTVFSDTIEKTDNPGLFILEAPMGEGKTEAALIGAEQLAERNSKSGLFMGLPTQATANGIFTRIKSWLCKISNEYDENISLQLKHSKSNLNEEYTSLATNINIDEVNDEKQHRRSDDEITLNQWLSDNNSVSDIISNKWFSGRKTSMLDDVVVGTVDNFLLAALKQKHLPLRHLGLSKKVVIIDEVHAYDAYMSEYLEQAIKWMGAYDVPVILLSATLPSKSRERFAKAYLRGKGLKNKEIVNNDEILLTTAYPLITYTDGNAICIVDKFEKIKNKAITVKKLNRNCLYDKVEELFSNDGIIGIIVNTVRDAQNIAKECAEIFGEDQIFLLHSGFIATERVKKEKELIEIIGKDASRPNKKIIIGTQVIEQSLDIDFDVMISDLAPMDLLIQRMGRLHRHNISRPKNYNNPVIYVMGTSDEFDFNKGSKYVYGGYLLAKTQEFLPDIINLPKDISKLVQGVYANEKNELELNSDERIKEMKNEFENERKKKRSRAKTYLLSNPEYERFNYEDEIVSMIGWLKDVNPNSAEEYGYAQVRDTQETIEVIALKRQGTGYGFFNSEEDVSDMLDDYNVLKKIAASTIKLPLLFSMYGNVDKTIDEIEKYNEKYLSDWQQKPLLKGSLGLIFDDKGDINLCGKRLHYSEKYGLSIIRKDDNDE